MSVNSSVLTGVAIGGESKLINDSTGQLLFSFVTVVVIVDGADGTGGLGGGGRAGLFGIGSTVASSSNINSFATITLLFVVFLRLN